MYQKPQPGEWQTDADGRRYRMIGNSKEYEMEILTTRGTIPASRLAAISNNAEPQPQPTRANKQYHCPFANGIQTDCKSEQCALYLEGCTLARSTPAKDTKGLICPFSRGKTACRTDCALYNGGCTITGINTEREDKNNE